MEAGQEGTKATPRQKTHNNVSMSHRPIRRVIDGEPSGKRPKSQQLLMKDEVGPEKGLTRNHLPSAP